MDQRRCGIRSFRIVHFQPNARVQRIVIAVMPILIGRLLFLAKFVGGEHNQAEPLKPIDLIDKSAKHLQHLIVRGLGVA